MRSEAVDQPIDQPIVDAHHHLWDLGERAYRFLDAPAHRPIRRSFGVDELTSTVGPHGVGQTVVIQAAPELGETEQLLKLAASSPLIGAVVGWLDFGAADASDQLDRLLSHPHGGLVAGIRAMAQDHPDPNWLASDAVARAAAVVGAAGLVCELLIRPEQAPAALALAGGLPEVRFVIDHAGKPPIATGELEPWATGIRRLAGLPHTACKVSGLITEADWTAWTVDQIAPVVAVVAEAFGEDRILFGSDWPVCLLAGGYADVLDAARRTLAPLPAEKVFAANARRIYNLPAGAAITQPTST